MVFTSSALRQHLPATASRFWVALSGGLDSVVLLHALVQLRLSTPITALHVNHQISPHAQRWQQRCADMCAAWGVEYVSEKVIVERRGRGLEDAAREARYAVFEHYVKADEYLLTAHHADDQAETILLRLLRGSGPRGLAAMARQRSLGQGWLLRPLLDFTRPQLESYAVTHHLQWVEDESNGDIRYDRNYLRQSVMPFLRTRWPAFAHRWQQSAHACAENEQLLEEFAAEDLLRASPQSERRGASLFLPILRQLSTARRHNLLRFWFRQHQYAAPEIIHLQQIDAQIIHGRSDSEAEVSWGNVVVRRFRERLYSSASSGESSFQAQGGSSIVQLSGATCEYPLEIGSSLVFEYCASASEVGCLRGDVTRVEIRSRIGGERCRPAERTHSQTLKKLLQEHALEPWWREQLPLIYVDDQLAAVGDLWICAGFAAPAGTPGYRIRWRLE